MTETLRRGSQFLFSCLSCCRFRSWHGSIGANRNRARIRADVRWPFCSGASSQDASAESPYLGAPSGRGCPGYTLWPVGPRGHRTSIIDPWNLSGILARPHRLVSLAGHVCDLVDRVRGGFPPSREDCGGGNGCRRFLAFRARYSDAFARPGAVARRDNSPWPRSVAGFASRLVVC